MLAGNSSIWTNGALVDNDAFGESLFYALPGEKRDVNGFYYPAGHNGWLWCYAGNNPMCRRLNYIHSEVWRQYISTYEGFSVRCVKD